MSTLKTVTIIHPSSAVNNIVNDSSGNVAVGNNLTVAGDITSSSTLAMGSSFKRNRIINGNMLIDQRNAGASVTIASTGSFGVDRWYAVEDTDGTMTMQQSSTAPSGFTSSMVFTTGTADSSLAAAQYVIMGQQIEGLNVYDLGWGTASAQTVTLSFWVRSSLTGTFGGAVRNSASNRSYPFSYSISAANTWEQKNVTITGDTSGTWLTDTGVGIRLTLGLGVGSTYSGTAGSWSGSNYYSATSATSVIGTAGATFYITGVQLEVGTIATPYERQIYSDQLAQCQRYYEVCSGIYMTGYNVASAAIGTIYGFKVTKRTAPTLTVTTTPDYSSNSSGFTVRIPTVNSFQYYAISGVSGNTVFGDNTQGVVTASTEL